MFCSRCGREFEDTKTAENGIPNGLRISNTYAVCRECAIEYKEKFDDILNTDWREYDWRKPQL